MEILAKRLKWLREKERYSQKEIAAKIEMTPSGYQKIEYGERDPKLETVVKLCDIYDISADFLLGRDSSTEELQRLSREILRNSEHMTVCKHESSDLIMKITNLRSKMIEVAREKGFVDEETMQVSDELDNKIRQYDRIRQRIDVLEAERISHIKSYIDVLLEIPESNPKNDPMIKEYLPFNTHLQMNIFNEFELILVGEKIGGLGTFQTYKSENEAVKAEEDLLKRLNGNQN